MIEKWRTGGAEKVPGSAGVALGESEAGRGSSILKAQGRKEPGVLEKQEASSQSEVRTPSFLLSGWKQWSNRPGLGPKYASVSLSIKWWGR